MRNHICTVDIPFSPQLQLETDSLVNAYKVLIRSVLDYANVISAACTKMVKGDLEVIQNNALRIIYKKIYYGPCSTEIVA